MDIKDNDRYKMFTRRAAIMSVGALGTMATLFGRLYYIQVLQSDKYKVLSEDNRVNLELLAPLRGRILDRFGTELATNRSNFRLILVPGQTPDVAAALEALHKIIPLTQGQKAKVLRSARRQPKYSTVTVLQNLNWEDFAKVNIQTPDLGGIKPDAGVTRHYPFGSDVVHVVGYVGAVNENEIDEDPLLSLPGFRIGKKGVEKFGEQELRGKAGSRQVEVNASGQVVRELSRREGDPGQDTVLTIDLELQRYAMRRLEGQSGAVVVMDIHNGDILALASGPGYDPNDFNLGMPQDTWNALQSDPYKPLLNKTINGQYPPGSTFKMVVALAGLEAGVISPNEWVRCRGRVRLGGHDFHCWRRGGHGSLSMRNAIKQSCDVYFYEVARRLGVDRIAEMAVKFGLGQTYDFGIPGEKPGLVPTTGWKIANMGERWQKGETLIAGIGQGYLLTTPLQQAVMTSRLANGGFQVMPRIIRSVGKQASELVEAKPIGVSDENLQIVLQGMNAVSNEPGARPIAAAFGTKALSWRAKPAPRRLGVSPGKNAERASCAMTNCRGSGETMLCLWRMPRSMNRAMPFPSLSNMVVADQRRRRPLPEM